MSEAGAIKIGAVQLDVDEMPLPGCACSVPRSRRGRSLDIGLAQVASLAISCAVIRSEHRDQLGARLRLEILLGDECDDLMTLVAPSEGVR